MQYVRRYYLYSFEHIDTQQFQFAPEEPAEWDGTPIGDAAEANFVRELLRRAGWEGDGKLRLIWLPPFVFREHDTIGELIWHVKQSNNGTSWLCSTVPLPFPALAGDGYGGMLALLYDRLVPCEVYADPFSEGEVNG